MAKRRTWERRVIGNRVFYEFYEGGVTAKVQHNIGESLAYWNVDGGGMYKQGREPTVAKAKSKAWMNLRYAQRA